MNNKNNQTNRSLLDKQRTTSTGEYNQFQKNTSAALDNSRTESNALRGQIRDLYSNSNNFMPSGMKPNASGWFDTSALDINDGGNAAGGDFSGAKSGYQRFADTGNAEDFAKAQRGYDELSSTGGIDAGAMRRAGETQIPAFYDAYKRSAQRRSNVQGGYSPGFDAQMAELGREKAREGFTAARQIEGDIAGRMQTGKIAGAGGSAGIASQISGNRLAGLGGLTNIGGMGSAAGLQSLYSSAPGDVGQNMQAWLEAQRGKTGNELGNIGTRANIQDKSFLTDVLPQLVGASGAVATGFGNRNRNTGINGGFGEYGYPSYGSN